MKISYNWLQNYFEKKIPAPEELARLLTMHSSEIEAIEKVGDDAVLDIKILPNLAHNCLSHRGIADEVSAITGLKRKTASIDLPDFKISETTQKLSVTIADPKKCRRYVGRIVEGIHIGTSPKWLVDALASLGQKSINNVVDATNFVMFELGQPLHAFDADKISENDITISVEDAIGGSMQTLDNKEVKLNPSILVIASNGSSLALAGVKGGKYAEIDSQTKNIIIESANFNPTLVRKTSRRLNIITDSSKRFENELSPEVAEQGMDLVTRLIVSIAGGNDTKVGEVVDVYPKRPAPYKVGVSLSEINTILGTKIATKEVDVILNKLNFPFEKVNPREKVVSLAPTFLATPYVYGASVVYDAPKVFDCSSFTAFLYAQGGVAIPRMAYEQARFGTEIKEAQLQSGDLVFSKTPDSKIGEGNTEEITHAGIYLGEGKIIHASGTPVSKVVVEGLKQSEKFKDVRRYARMLRDEESRFVVTVPAERLDVRVKEDLIEEIGRIYGYEKVVSVQLPKSESLPVVHTLFYYSTKVRSILSTALFTEISTYAMVAKGKLELLNPMATDKAFMRVNLSDAMTDALTLNARNADLIGVSRVRLFDIGKVFDEEGEYTRLTLGTRSAGALSYNKKDGEELKKVLVVMEKELGTAITPLFEKEGVVEIDFDALIAKLPKPKEYDEMNIAKDVRFKSISSYPFVSRDIAVFLPESVDSSVLENIIIENGTDLCVHYRLFDVFTKAFPDGTKKTSYAYRLVFQSQEKTLTEGDVAPIMESIIEKMREAPSAEVR